MTTSQKTSHWYTPFWKGICIIFKLLDKGITQIFLLLIRIYQWTLSPDMGIFSPLLKGKICAHEPHCSAYAVEVLKRYGFFYGIGMIMERILSCKPSLTMTYDPSHYSVIFFSSAEIGVPFLEKLQQDRRFEVVGVVTQGDKPVGRGMTLQENIIKQSARRLFPEQGSDFSSFCQTPETLRKNTEEGDAFAEWIAEKKADFLIVISYGKIIPQRILDGAKLGAINIHGSLLPRYRGASPLQSVFLEQEKETGITIMHMDAGMDTGAIIQQLKIPLKFGWTTQDLITEFQKEGPDFFVDTVWNFGKGMIEETPQAEIAATYCKKIEKSDGEVQPFQDSLEDIFRKYQAFYLWPKVWFLQHGKRCIIETLEIDESQWNQWKVHPMIEGKTLSPCIKNIALKPEGKKAMDWKSFSNGYLK